MNAKLSYPGEKDVAELNAIVSSYHRDSAVQPLADLKSYFDSFFNTIQSGVSVSTLKQILKDHIDIVATLLQDDSEDDIPFEFADYLVSAWKETGVLNAVWFLEPASAFQAYVVYDEMQARRCLEYADSDLAEGLKIVDEVVSESPIPPAESMFFYAKYGKKTDPGKAYEFAQKLYDLSSNEKNLAIVRSILHDEDLLYAHHWQNGSAKDRQSLSELRALDHALTQEFGADYYWYGYRSQTQAVISGVFKMFSERAQAEDKELTDYRHRLIARVTSAAGIFGKSPYVSAYAEYLRARILAATNDIKGALKQFNSALQAGFAPFDPLVYSAQMYLFRKKPEEAKRILEEWLPVFDFAPEDYITAKGNSVTKAYLECGGTAQAAPSSITEKIKERAKTNAGKVDTFIAILAQQKDEKIKTYWQTCYANTLKSLDTTLEPHDYDLLLEQNGHQARKIQMPMATAATQHWDELHGLKDEEKETLIRSCYDPTAATELAKISASHLLAETANWQDLVKEYASLGQSSYLGISLFERFLANGKIDGTQQILKDFMSRNVFAEETSISLFAKLQGYFEANKDYEGKLDLEESFVKRFSASQQERIRESFTTTILKLVDQSGNTLEKIKLLERGLAMDGNHAKIQKLLQAEKNKRNKMIMIAVGCGLGAILLLYLLDLMFNIF